MTGKEEIDPIWGVVVKHDYPNDFDLFGSGFCLLTTYLDIPSMSFRHNGKEPNWEKVVRERASAKVRLRLFLKGEVHVRRNLLGDEWIDQLEGLGLGVNRSVVYDNDTSILKFRSADDMLYLRMVLS